MGADFFQAVTLGIALVGAVLGVLNTWRNWSLDRLRVKVTPGYAEFHPGGVPHVHIEVVNLSSFPVTLVSVGFTLLGSSRHIQIPSPWTISGVKLPHRLDARASLTFFTPLAALDDEQCALISNAYVKTACGSQIEGDSVALRQIVNAASAALV